MGAMVGYWMVCKAWKYLPELESFDREIAQITVFLEIHAK